MSTTYGSSINPHVRVSAARSQARSAHGGPGSDHTMPRSRANSSALTWGTFSASHTCASWCSTATLTDAGHSWHSPSGHARSGVTSTAMAVALYQDVYKLTYVRGPSGIIVILAEELKKG